MDLEVKTTENRMESLEEIRHREQFRRLCVVPIAIAFVLTVVAILYMIVKIHCFVDIPLFVILAVVSLILIRMMIVRGRELSNRIDRMIEERGRN